MESANLHRHLLHQQLQENLNTSHAAAVGSSSSSSYSSLAPRESYYGIKHANWTQHHPTIHRHHLSNLSNSSFNSSNMEPDLGIHCSWPPPISDLMNAGGGGGSGSSNIKEELSSSSSDSTFPKFTQMLTSNSTTSLNMVDDDDYPFSGRTSLTSLSLMKNDQHKEMMMNDLREKLLLKTLSSTTSTSSGINSSPGDHLFYTSTTAASNNNHVPNFTQLLPGRSGGHCFSQIYPSINISNLNQHQQSSSSLSSPSAISSCSSNLDINLQAMDLLASSGFSSTQPPSNSLLLDHHHHHHQEIKNSFGQLQHMQQSRTHHDHDYHSLLSRGSDFNSKMPSFENNEVTDQVKRRPAGSLIETKATQAGAAPKKSRLESRTPCPPFKVRKEKLGDRIASLQQLVAPFGKTDTASVLMEAIGYIKFLQNQVETLSVPYMKSSRNNKPSKTIFQGGVVEMNGGINGDHERQRDLRSRGLCLVPLSCLSYVTAGAHDVTTTAATGSVNWPGPNYGRGGTST